MHLGEADGTPETVALGALSAHLFILHAPPTIPGTLLVVPGVWDDADLGGSSEAHGQEHVTRG